MIFGYLNDQINKLIQKMSRQKCVKYNGGKMHDVITTGFQMEDVCPSSHLHI